MLDCPSAKPCTMSWAQLDASQPNKLHLAGQHLSCLQWGSIPTPQVMTAEMGENAITQVDAGTTWLRNHPVSWALLPGSWQGSQVFKQKLAHKHL